MDNQTKVLIVLGALYLAGLINMFSRMSRQKYNPLPEAQSKEIACPLEPIFDNYDDISDFIKICKSEGDLKVAYARIIIFQGLYGSCVWLSELVEMYLIKESDIKSPSQKDGFHT